MSLPKRLLDGYANFRKGRYASESERYRKLGEGQQKPKIMMIACCDSRAAPETIFDAGPGEMFVVRNVANLVPPYTPDGGHHATSAALEFAVLSLAVEHIVVMGHGRCGGIRVSRSTSYENAAVVALHVGVVPSNGTVAPSVGETSCGRDGAVHGKTARMRPRFGSAM